MHHISGIRVRGTVGVLGAVGGLKRPLVVPPAPTPVAVASLLF